LDSNLPIHFASSAQPLAQTRISKSATNKHRPTTSTMRLLEEIPKTPGRFWRLFILGDSNAKDEMDKQGFDESWIVSRLLALFFLCVWSFVGAVVCQIYSRFVYGRFNLESIEHVFGFTIIMACFLSGFLAMEKDKLKAVFEHVRQDEKNESELIGMAVLEKLDEKEWGSKLLLLKPFLFDVVFTLEGTYGDELNRARVESSMKT
jgi:hypothetical protein